MNLETRPFTFRFWHWVNGVVLLGSLLTVFLRKTFLSTQHLAGTLTSSLSGQGVILSQEQAKIAARAVRDGVWEWHYRFGFMLAGLFVFRFVFGRWPFPRPKTLKDSTHGIFYLALLFMIATGLGMYFSGTFGFSESFVDEIEEIHEAGLWVFVAFLPLHLFGVVRAELTDQAGLVSRMIHGKSK